MSAAIELKLVEKTFGEGAEAVHAFGPADLDIQPGEFVSLLGPSGCSKSTVMLMMAGLLERSQGDILVNGRSVDRPQTDTGIMFQDNTLMPWRTVQGNVEIQLELRGLPLDDYRKKIYPFFVSIEMTPKIAFAPLFISWLGFGLLPKVIIVFLVCFFPIVLNSILAFSSLSEELTHFCRATGAGAVRTFFKVRLPAALPQCFVGFKYAPINATVGATIAEFIGSDEGLGFYFQIVTGNMRPDLAFAGIFLLTLLGLALFGLVTLAERLLIPWHIS